MKKRDIYKPTMIREYTGYMNQAVKRGVSFDDIINETRKYHGTRFTELILNEFSS